MFVQAFYLYKQAAGLDNSFAMYKTELFYCYGVQIAKNHEQAFAYFNRAVERGSKEALFHLALCYERGYGAEKDEKLASKLYVKYFKDMNTESLFEEGLLYSQPAHSPYELDCGKAFVHFREVARRRHIKALFELGLCYANVYRVQNDFKQALAAFQEAVDKGYDLALLMVAQGYRLGWGVAKDLLKAIGCYR